MEITTLILGAGAAGLFCAGGAGPGVVVVDHAAAPGEKIRISGGGRCNFTNLRTGPDNFLSGNRHFHKSALAGFSPADFLTLVERNGIAWHEKTLGQLFCDGKSVQIVDLLRARAAAAGAELWLNTEIGDIAHDGGAFVVALVRGGRQTTLRARNLVVATGGKSIPKMGATGIAYRIAAQFGLAVTDTRPGLVPFTLSDNPFAPLSGLSLPVRAGVAGQSGARRASFDEAMLFTHRGLSGPAMLQVSSYWRDGEELRIDLAPGADLAGALRGARRATPKRGIAAVLADHLPARLATALVERMGLTGPIGPQSDAALQSLAQSLHGWAIRPTATEGYRTAEVTLGGVDTAGLSSRTMQAAAVPGLYFIGECVDVTGWLGGYNFQWAWASAHAAAAAIRAG